jgi:Tfp pilus assembly protein PilV
MNELRRGFSLLEVLLATTILLGAIVVLGQLTSIGYRNATAARDETTAQLLCQSILNEMVAGIRPLAPAAEAPIFNQPGWLSAATVYPVAQPPGLVAVEVTVRQDRPVEKRPVEFKLRRWLLRPGLNINGAAPSTADESIPAPEAPALPPP